MPLNKNIQKVLMIGSGPIVIGQAAEFDYAGAQACSVLKDAGLNVVLVNSNPATIMTDKTLADEIYLEPLTARTVKRIIEKERPDSVLASMGGQTGLTIAMQLHKEGFLERMGVRLIGTNAEAIDKAEDRQLFKDTMQSIGQPVIPSGIATDAAEAARIAAEIGYPVIVRPAFTLGGAGGGVAYDETQLLSIAKNGLMLSPITQVLVEKYIYGWKEIEFEIMRDAADNCIAVCSMENFDPVGVHTGDSIVIAPAVTLSDKEYQMLRSASLSIIRALKIEGGCNCQFALNPESFEYAVIEVNPRVSRSSALASKATGYPIAKVAAKIALGYTLDEIPNDITGKTCACFEPTLDYVVIKMPKWPFDKFVHASRALGTQMKATGEVMAIAPSFEMAILKAVRGAEISLDTLNLPEYAAGDARERLYRVDDRRLFAIFAALKAGLSVEEIHDITRVDEWFLYKLERMATFEMEYANNPLGEAAYLAAKRMGYTDKALRRITGHPLPTRREFVYKMVDTCGAEFDAVTPYFYSTCDNACEARAFTRGSKQRVLVLGSGPIRIGQGIEFDYSSVHCVRTLRQMGYEVAIINNNPETVSTDFSTADRLYFEPLTEEDVLNVIAVERPIGVVAAFGGQTAIRLAKCLQQANIPLLGTSASSIDLAEDRERFDALLEQFKIRRPAGRGVRTMEEAMEAAQTLGYPVLVRPSYVIGGQNMTIAYAEEDIRAYMAMILAQGIDNPVLVDQYLMGIELEVDVICDGRDVLIPGIMEHIERAGVHSGDSIAVYPPQNVNDNMLQTIIDCSQRLALAMGSKGLVNIQYLIYHNELYVIEVNPRASRTVPYLSKVTGVPMVELATRVMAGEGLRGLGYGTGLYRTSPYVAVKVPVFSFEKLSDADAALGPEMKSTGEVLGVGKTLEEALFKGLLSAGFHLPSSAYDREGGVLISVNRQDRLEIVRLAKTLDDLHMKLYATPGTARAIEQLGIDVEKVVNPLSEDDSILELLESGKLSYIVFTGKGEKAEVTDYIRLHRRALQLGVAVLTSLDTANALASIIASRFNQDNTELADINHLRASRQKLHFWKMHATGNDCIVLDNRDGSLSCPESLAISFCNRNTGIGGEGVAMIERSSIADARLRVFNQDGSEGKMGGNSIRCVGKYLYDRGIVKKERMRIETASGIRALRLNLFDGAARSIEVDMGKASLQPQDIPVLLEGENVINRPFPLAGSVWNITCVSMGNPHCVVFVERVDSIDIAHIGPQFENALAFPERVNTEFVRVVNRRTLKMRVWERGNGETTACGTGACAAVVAAVENGYCDKDTDITVKVRGGDLIVRYTGETVYLTGGASLVYEGIAEY